MKPIEEVHVPHESVNDEVVRVVAVHVRSGDAVEEGAALIELETSKVNITVDAQSAGYVAVDCSLGQDVGVGDVIARIFSEPVDPAEVAPPPASRAEEVAIEGGTTVFSDAAVALLKERGVSKSEFEGRGYITAEEVRKKLAGREAPSGESVPGGSGAEPETAGELARYLEADLFRYDGRTGWGAFAVLALRAPEFRCIACYRVRKFLKSRPLMRLMLGPFLRLIGDATGRKYGIRLPLSAEVGRGLYIGHWGGIWISPGAVIGENCNLSNDISIGAAGPSARLGHPVVGDRVFIGPGVRINGPISIGDKAVLSANSFVSSSVPESAVMVGVPAKVVSYAGSDGFINHVPGAAGQSEVPGGGCES